MYYILTQKQTPCRRLIGFRSPRRGAFSVCNRRKSVFAHLHVHSGFSFMYGTFLPEALAAKAKEAGFNAAALTDKNGVYGAVRFCAAAEKLGVHAVIGTQLTIEGRDDLVLLARSPLGYNNLCRLITLAHEYGPRDQPACPEKFLALHSRDIVCLTGGRDGRFCKLVEGAEGTQYRRACGWVWRLQEIFGRENVFVEIQNAGTPYDARIMHIMARVAEKAGAPLAATNDVVCLEPADLPVHQALVDIQNQVHHRACQARESREYYLKSQEDMAKLIPYPQALENTGIIAHECRAMLPLGKSSPPVFPVPPGMSQDQALAKLCYRSLARRFNPLDLKVLRRLEKELGHIRRRDLSGYFLLVKEIHSFAKTRRIRGTVRGSAAGSLVLHLLLGGVNPLEHRLLFERFLNNGRLDMPDVDMDFDSLRRDEIFEYLMEKYPNQAAMVATVSTFRARGALRSLGRALGYSYEKIDRLTQFVPHFLRSHDIRKAIERMPELEGSPLLQEDELLWLAEKISGLPHNLSVHLGGMVLTPGEIFNWSPLQTSRKGIPVVQFDKDDVEALGLVKLDILGLRMHSALQAGVELLEEKGVRLCLDEVPLDDPATFRMLRTTDSVGVFQVESPGQRQLLGRLQPRHFEDIIAEISLFRPGPMSGAMVEPYVLRRNNKEPVTYPHPDLKPILESTFGVVLFQEQILEIAHDIAGMPYGEGDRMRRSLSKKAPRAVFREMEEAFVKGCLKKGYDNPTAQAFFDLVASFMGYGFCKAHAASFAHITYQSAYLKTHYPLAFYFGILNAEHVGSYPHSVILNEARRMGISVLQPHVNKSGVQYQEENGGIRIPLIRIKNIGPKYCEKIILERENGLFLSADDFTKRVSLPAKARFSLEKAGALKGLDGAWNAPPPVFRDPVVTSPGLSPHAAR